jgi:hypothetical protein
MNVHDRSNLSVFYHSNPEITRKIVFTPVVERETKITSVITLPARNSFSSFTKRKKSRKSGAVDGSSPGPEGARRTNAGARLSERGDQNVFTLKPKKNVVPA